jgi:asparagine synthase (glutamine-hydrolysing)
MKKSTPDGKPITFNIGFKGKGPEKEYDESEFAMSVAEALNTEHHDHYPKAYDMAKVAVAASWYFNLPCCTGLPNFFVSEMARRYVKVAMAGVGGDELFAGYSRFDYAEAYAMNSSQAEVAFVRSLCSVDEKLKKQLFTQEFFSETKNEPSVDFILEQFTKIRTREVLNKLCLIDLRHYMLNDLLFNLDKMSMAHSLEVRVPFLDHRLVEFALSIPPEYKIHRHIRKYALKRLIYRKLPSHVCIRPKWGFSIPKELWIKSAREFILSFINKESVTKRGIFEWKSLKSFMSEVLDGEYVTWAGAQNLWTILILEIWFRQFFDQRPSLKPPPLEDLTEQYLMN